VKRLSLSKAKRGAGANHCQHHRHAVEPACYITNGEAEGAADDSSWRRPITSQLRAGNRSRPAAGTYSTSQMRLRAGIRVGAGGPTARLPLVNEGVRSPFQFACTPADGTTGLYVDGEGSSHSSLHANLYALMFGLVPAERAANLVGCRPWILYWWPLEK